MVFLIATKQIFKNCEPNTKSFLPQLVYVVLTVNDKKREKAHIIFTYHFKLILPYYITGTFQCSSN